MWTIRLFGQFEAQRATEPPVRRFRSRSAAAVLAYLALHLDRAVPREELCEAIWPENDPELARSSLRTAVFSLRRQLPDESKESIIDCDRTHVWLTADSVTTDYAKFLAAFKSLEASETVELRFHACQEAVALVRGQLLAHREELWATPHQIAFEEMYSQCVVGLIDGLGRQNRYDEAFATGRSALTLVPYREDIHVALIRSLNEAGRTSEAIRQFELLERLLDEQWGEAPSDDAVKALESGARKRDQSPPVPTQVPPASRAVIAGAPETIDQSESSVPLLNRRIFGREQDIKRLCDGLRPSESSIGRLWTITGAGGCGKTVLAISVGLELRDAYSGRVAFVDLAPVGQAGLALSRIAEALGVHTPGSHDIKRRVLDELASDPRLLILDNAEHLVPEISSLVDELMEACSRIRVLVTSRSLLGLEGERAYPVSTLQAPELGQDLSEVAKVPSVMLFLDRAEAIRPDFTLTPNNAPAIIELCRRLEGLPLAIELAAAQTSVMSPSQVLVRFGDHSFQLRNKLRDASERHRSLESVLAWSYGLLQESDQCVFRALSAFRGSFTLDAVQAVTGLEDVFDSFENLVSSSLVERIDTSEGFRFRLLTPIQSYATLKAVEAGENLDLRERHLQFYVELAEAHRVMFQGPRVGEASYVFELEHENFRQCADWAISTKTHAADACWLIGCMTNFITMRGYFVEWSRRIEEILSFATPEDDALSIGFGHNVAGMLAYYSSQDQTACRHFEAAVARFREHGNLANVAGALNNHGMVLTGTGHFEAAASVFEQGLEAMASNREQGLWQTELVSIALRCNLASLYRYRGESKLALKAVTEARAQAESLKLMRILPPILLEIAAALQCEGDFVESVSLAQKAETLAESLGITANITDAQRVQAWALLHAGQLEDAVETARKSIPWSRTAQAAGPLAEAIAICGLSRKDSDSRWAKEGLRIALGLRPGMTDRLSPWQRDSLIGARDEAGLSLVEELAPNDPQVERFLDDLTTQDRGRALMLRE